MTTHASPVTEAMARPGKGTSDPGESTVPFDWAATVERFRTRPPTFWLTTVATDGAPHVVPLFASWTADRCYVATSPGARKTADLHATGRCVLSADLGDAHTVVEATAHRVVDTTGLEDAVATITEVYGWPVTIVGSMLDAPFAAPTSGGAPFEVWQLTPTQGFAFPADGVSNAPTRWTFATTGADT